MPRAPHELPAGGGRSRARQPACSCMDWGSRGGSEKRDRGPRSRGRGRAGLPLPGAARERTENGGRGGQGARGRDEEGSDGGATLPEPAAPRGSGCERGVRGRRATAGRRRWLRLGFEWVAVAGGCGAGRWPVAA
ncbi:hypothetical protein BS78_04G144400 [Paspalum vaginatum]|nr:hypothetical protein BS78_04G144400 [Paspalum vaginatum]